MARTINFNDEDAFFTTSDAGMGKRPYTRKVHRPDTHSIPQLKLFAGELAFLTLAVGQKVIENSVIVYAGAAAGNHIPLLAAFFPDTHFYLYDTEQFEIDSTKYIHIFREEFTEDVARAWRLTGQQIIFISDIRNMKPHGSKKKYEQEIAIDMAKQALWVEIMQPTWWSLKFRIPYPIVSSGKDFPYLSGFLMMQPFAKTFSMEMRLVGREEHARIGAKAVVYNTRELEQRLFYHNTIVRPEFDRFANALSFDQQKYKSTQFDHGYDCTYFLYVLDTYMETPYAVHSGAKVPDVERLDFAERMIEEISRGKWTIKTHKDRKSVHA